jgi:hypothetical protein
MVWPVFAPWKITSLLLFGSLFTALMRLRKGQRLSFFSCMDNVALTNAH